MPPTTQSRQAHAYAERIRAWLPRRVQELREAAGMSRYALEKVSGVSRDMIGSVESGESIPTLHLCARLAHGLGLTVPELLTGAEVG
jgi:transcriptional regulator with XRE-family HTH domain